MLSADNGPACAILGVCRACRNELAPPPSSSTTSTSTSTTATQQPTKQLNTILPLRPPSRKRTFANLLRRDIYTPITPADVPPALRSSIPSLHPTLSASLASLEEFLSHGRFFSAAVLVARILTSPLVEPWDGETIFDLVWVRLACLELCGLTAVAAQEAKCLGDTKAAFYYDEVDEKEKREDVRDVNVGERASDAGAGDAKDGATRTIRVPIIPWHLRVLAIRLQSIGLNEPRRGCSAIYELGREARRHLARNDVPMDERKLWRDRLAELGVRNVNALLSMGVLDVARRTLDSLHWPSDPTSLTAMYMAVLHIRLGDVDAARKLIEAQHYQSQDGEVVTALAMMIEGRCEEASTLWEALMERYSEDSDNDNNRNGAHRAMMAQNLALSQLYSGRADKVR